MSIVKCWKRRPDTRVRVASGPSDARRTPAPGNAFPPGNLALAHWMQQSPHAFRSIELLRIRGPDFVRWTPRPALREAGVRPAPYGARVAPRLLRLRARSRVEALRLNAQSTESTLARSRYSRWNRAPRPCCLARRSLPHGDALRPCDLGDLRDVWRMSSATPAGVTGPRVCNPRVLHLEAKDERRSLPIQAPRRIWPERRGPSLPRPRRYFWHAAR